MTTQTMAARGARAMVANFLSVATPEQKKKADKVMAGSMALR